MVKQNSEKEQEWYETWFGREYLEVYSHRDRHEAIEDIDNIGRLLPLSDSQPILDLACGSGRHSLELARRGFDVTGVDLSAELLEVARTSASREGLEIEFVQSDMRRLPFSEKFGCVLNLFTSFGYFETDEENAEIMAAIHGSLKPGGVFLIDYINRDLVLATLVPEDKMEINGKQILQQRRFNRSNNRLEKTIIITSKNEEKTFIESLRLYNRDELISMAESSGLNVITVMGSLAGEEFQPSSPRTILFGKKPN